MTSSGNGAPGSPETLGATAGTEEGAPGTRNTEEGRRPRLQQRNAVIRIAVGLPAVVILAGLILWAPPFWIALVVAAFGVYGTFEFTQLFRREEGTGLPLAVMLISSVFIGLGALGGTPAAFHGGLLAGVLLTALSGLIAAPRGGGEAMSRIGISLAGLLLIPWLLNHLSLLLRLPEGRMWMAFLVTAVILNDTLAYVVGTLLGRRPLLPSVSPSKTLEGSLGGMGGGLIAAGMAFVWWPAEDRGISLAWLLAIGVVLAVAGQAGDLLESKLKRLAGVKDSGLFLPGHGGLLDRIDAFLLAAPVCYYLVLSVLALGGGPG